MIDYYGYITTMSWRAVIALEELGLEYRFHSVNLGKGEQRSPEHTARNPMQAVPVIVDQAPAGGGEPVSVFESGAILMYLAEKAGKLMPTEPRERAEFFTWFFWVITGYGSALGYCGGSFHREKKYRLFSQTDYGSETYELFTEASIRAHGKLEERLEGRDYICGEYSIADIAALGSTVPLLLHGIETLDQHPNLARWYRRLRERPAVERALALGRDVESGLPAYYSAALFDDGWQERAR